MQRITIMVGDKQLQGELNTSATAQEVAAQLPLSASASVWGDEIYFAIPVTAAEASDARAEVEIGTLAYWPPGNAFCIFYGPTPASRDTQPHAASPVNVIGRIQGDATALRGTRSGAAVRIEAVRSAE